MQSWGYGKPHYYKNCPQRTRIELTTSVQEAYIVGEVAKNILSINASPEDHYAKYQPAMVELEGKIASQSVSILIDPRASLTYVSAKKLNCVTCQVLSLKIHS